MDGDRISGEPTGICFGDCPNLLESNPLRPSGLLHLYLGRLNSVQDGKPLVAINKTTMNIGCQMENNRTRFLLILSRGSISDLDYFSMERQ